MLRVGSLCTGYGGLEMGIREVFGDIDLIFTADNDPGASAILAWRYPGVPNLGDISAVDYSRVASVDLLAAGFPCTDVSSAGRREGLRKGTRTGLWYEVARAVRELQPPMVFLENVDGLLSGRAGNDDNEFCPWCLGDGSGESVLRAFGTVLWDLSSLGYDAEWETLPASDTGAPHRRNRVFILAWRQGAPAGDA